MGKLKLSLFLLLTLALIVLGLFLPQFTTQMVDAGGANTLHTQTFLQTTPQETQQPLTNAEDSLQRLALFDKSNLVSVSDHVATQTPADIEARVNELLGQLIDLGLVEGGLGQHPVTLYLSMDPNDPSRYILVWRVRYTNTESRKDFLNLELLIDDETGKLLHIYYSTPDAQSNLPAKIGILTEFYFSQLGLDQEDYFVQEDYNGNVPTYISRYYTFPGDDALETELLVEVDSYYLSINIVHSNVEAIEP